ncbi:hypothetical protein GCM10023323_40850 [Streptomyces thinghirensis]|uniref:Secreted protein n=1 Tax=Streptomyces thinghirensis TaxID=551547 RepID=A0ABP9T4P6_9ACTN
MVAGRARIWAAREAASGAVTVTWGLLGVGTGRYVRMHASCTNENHRTRRGHSGHHGPTDVIRSTPEPERWHHAVPCGTQWHQVMPLNDTAHLCRSEHFRFAPPLTRRH